MNGFEQLSLTDYTKRPYIVPKHKICRIIELFAGVGSQSSALQKLGIPMEHYRVVEFDKFAIASYNSIFGTDFPTIDIRDVHGADLGIVDKDKYEYLLTYSFPCTDLSVAGKMAGMSKEAWASGESTRSGLLWEVERILNELREDELPQLLLMENVPQVHSKANAEDFKSWLNFLESKGYSNYWQDLNAKDYGIAQSRNRTFMISILGDYTYEFPKPFPLEKKMKDYLEPEVDEKYYLTSDRAWELIDKLVKERKIPLED